MVAVLILVVQRFGPQIGAAVGWKGDLGSLPDFTLETLDGSIITRADLEGKVVLVNFWATWCGPCRVEMPGFERVYQDHRDRGFVILGLSTERGEREKVADYADRRGVTYPIAISTPALENAFGGLRGLPTSFLVDRDGKIRNRVFGFFASPALRLAVGRLLDSESEDQLGEQVPLDPPVPSEAPNR